MWQSDSVICIYIYILFHFLFHCDLSLDIEYSSLCYTVGPCLPLFYTVLYLLISNSQFIPTLSPLVATICFLCVLQSLFMNPHHDHPPTLRRGFLWMQPPDHMLQKHPGCAWKMQVRGPCSGPWESGSPGVAHRTRHWKPASQRPLLPSEFEICSGATG